jgi:hypothetical protein
MTTDITDGTDRKWPQKRNASRRSSARIGNREIRMNILLPVSVSSVLSVVVSFLAGLNIFAACEVKDGYKYENVGANGHPQITQISADEFRPDFFSICANLRNLWINPFVSIPSSTGLLY